MRNAKWFAGVVLGFAWMSVSVASDGVQARDPAAGARATYEAQTQAQAQPQPQPQPQQETPRMQGAQGRTVEKARQAPQGKTREEVKRELAAARASGCMDVSDSQYPQPCPLPDRARTVADAFQMR